MTVADAKRGFFSLPPGADFARRFSEGFHHRFAGHPPATVARTLILTNSGRTQRLLEETLADTAPGPGPLPRMVSISQLQSDPARSPGHPRAISSIRRQLRLTRLVEAYLRANARGGETLAPLSAAADLAESLALLIDQMHDEGIDPAALESAVADRDLSGDAAAHWQRSLQFIDIVRNAWPGMLAEYEGGALDPRARQTLVIDDLIAGWRAHPPETPVIAAGSTGSVASTARLLQAVAELPSGMVVLPGFDPELDPTIWEKAEADHPTGPFRRWMAGAGIRPSGVTPWCEGRPTPRRTLIAQALRPAPVTDHWHEAAGSLRVGICAATADISLIEASSARLEASAIALAIREAIETPDQRVTLITPDAALARRVTVNLAAFDIVPDDTSGQPLSQTPPGVLLALILQAASGRADAVQWAALLSHPLTQPGVTRVDHLPLARAYEVAVLRETHLTGGAVALPEWPEKLLERMPAGSEWIAGINAAIAGLTQALQGKAALGALLSAHVAAAEALTAGADPDEPCSIWGDEAGKQLQAFLERLVESADAFGGDPVTDYPALLRGLMQGETLRPRPREPHPRVAIRGPREARIEAADVVILAGLNEGTWPAPPDPGPWLSRPMHEAIGLPFPERSVGLSAHDFQQAVCQPRVILSRSEKIDGTPTVASRWLIRLQTLVEGIGEKTAWQAMLRRGTRFSDLATRMAQPDAPVARASRPAPTLAAIPEPRRLSVTEIETLIRDAYAVYARRVLRLHPLNPLGRAADVRERGNVVHEIMEGFTLATVEWPGADAARETLMQVADTVLTRDVPQADLRRVWRARVTRFADWFVTEEAKRREGATPLQPEVRGSMDMDLPNGPLEIRAKADRIDRLSDGSAAIYDYKTGTPPSESQIGSFSHQLHLQAAILATGGFRDIPAMEATEGAYIGLTGGKSGGKETRPK
ncbi:MAG: double-strand break repair protein AddB, partial [Pseudomonadota bacterium]